MPYFGQILDMREARCLAPLAKSISRPGPHVSGSSRPGKPYYRSLDQGLHVGYRKGVRGAAWVTRWYAGAEVYKVESLEGRPDDVLDADGETVLSWSEAQAEARRLFSPART